jgi:hypothetical protein
MQHPVVLRVEKHTSMGTIAGAGKHTWREKPTPNADPARTHLNEDWRPAHGSKDLRLAVKARLAAVTEKLATAKPVLCLEYVISAHHKAFKTNIGHDGKPTGDVDPHAYFRDALAWLEPTHGADNIVAVNMQLDEKAPHLVAFVVPLVDVAASTRKRSVIVGTNPDGTKIRETKIYETPAKTRLSAAHYMGSRELLSQMQTDIADQVGSKHGLLRGIKGSKASHVTIRDYYAALNQAKDQHVTVTAEDITPAVIETRLIGRNKTEDLETVAARLNEKLHKGYAPAMVLAGTARLHAQQAEEQYSVAQHVMNEVDQGRRRERELELRVSELESVADYLVEPQFAAAYKQMQLLAAAEKQRRQAARWEASALESRATFEHWQAQNAAPEEKPEVAKKVEIETKNDENDLDSAPNM